MNEKNESARAKRELTPSEEANLKVLQKIRPNIVDVVNALLASHQIEVVVARLDFADVKSAVGGASQRECAMCCCIGGYYSCCTAC